MPTKRQQKEQARLDALAAAESHEDAVGEAQEDEDEPVAAAAVSAFAAVSFVISPQCSKGLTLA